jgi:hypothetical protein
LPQGMRAGPHHGKRERSGQHRQVRKQGPLREACGGIRVVGSDRRGGRWRGGRQRHGLDWWGGAGVRGRAELRVGTPGTAGTSGWGESSIAGGGPRPGWADGFHQRSPGSPSLGPVAPGQIGRTCRSARILVSEPAPFPFDAAGCAGRVVAVSAAFLLPLHNLWLTPVGPRFAGPSRLCYNLEVIRVGFFPARACSAAAWAADAVPPRRSLAR